MEHTTKPCLGRSFLTRDWDFEPGMITIFTPSFADEADTNAQNLSVKEIVARLDPQRFAVTMFHEGLIDSRIAIRPNTRLLPWRKHGNTLRVSLHLLRNVPNIYFFPREGPLDAAFLTLRRRFRLRTAVVSYVVSGGLHNQPYFAARERHIREADAVFANNSYLAGLLREKMGIVASAVLYDGIDRRYYFPPESRQTARDGVTVLCAGSLRPYKRVSLVVQQAALFPEVRFRIAGTGEEESAIKNLATKLGCKNVDFLGHLSQQQLGEEMRRADIFFFPSTLEGHPQVLLQAAGSGLPIVAMRIYRPDCVVDGTTGFLVDTDDELSTKLRELLANPGTRRMMGDAAVVHAQKFDWEQIAEKWQQEFERVIERNENTEMRKVNGVVKP
jgi:glycosyltransferase involved in cell wall biosynthesis